MRIVSGMRPTGKLHLGHYLGVIKNWLSYQKEGECFYFVADWHALSTTYEDKLHLRNLSHNLVREWIACGIDPEKSTIYIQSDVPEVAELYLLLNMITPLGWLERNPTYKDQLQQLGNKDIHTAGFLSYPTLQCADIILYDADCVPIGEDQKPHLEISREIVRRFHHLYESDLFKEPKEILSEVPRLLGLDGRKMSKSYNNAIYLTESEDELMKKLKSAKTDTKRVKKTDPGNPNVCLVFGYHKECTDEAKVQEIESECRAGTIGCMDCKKICFESVKNILSPIWERYESTTDSQIEEIITDGNAKAQTIARDKLEAVKTEVFTRA